MCACVRACVRVCVRACVSACVRACVCPRMNVGTSFDVILLVVYVQPGSQHMWLSHDQETYSMLQDRDSSCPFEAEKI